MTDQQLAVLLYHIAQQIKTETYRLYDALPEENRGAMSGLNRITESLFAQADQLRGKYMSPNL
jgi:hypothetical protein